MDRIVKHWVERAEYDLETAKAMLDSARYLYVAILGGSLNGCRRR